MPHPLNATHDPALRSWVESANADGGDFPLQNLPFGLFRTADDAKPRGGVALGDRVIDLARLGGALDGPAADAARAAAGPSLLPLVQRPPAAVSALRAVLSALYAEGSTAPSGLRVAAREALLPIASVELLRPIRPPNFADFCCSIDHIRRMAAVSGRPIHPCADRLPVGYNGRASSVAVSGTSVVRPRGQFEAPPGSGAVRFGPEPRLDYELELGVWLRGGNPLGAPVAVADAEAMLFGCGLVNDWSARGLQFFESMLGPHVGKSFLTTVSPWIVTIEALAPFRVPARGRVDGEPPVPDHLLDVDDRAHGGFGLRMLARLDAGASGSIEIARSDFASMYWTLAQMVAHQASSGAPLEAGDLLASGTVSGPADAARGCLAEATDGGMRPLRLPDGTERRWLEDGDTVTLRARAEAPGFVPIGFGDCTGTVVGCTLAHSGVSIEEAA